MRKSLLLISGLFLFCFQNTFAQDEYDQANAFLDKADVLYDMYFNEDTLEELGKTKEEVIDEFIENFNEARKHMQAFSEQDTKSTAGISYIMGYYNTEIAELYERLGDNDNALTYISKAFTFRTSLNNPSRSDVNNFLDIDPDDWNYSFIYQLYYASRINMALKNYDKTLELTTMMDPGIASANYYDAFGIYHNGGRAADNLGKKSLEMDYRTKSLEYFPRMKQDDQDRNVKLIPDIIKNIEAINTVDDPEQYANAARAINALGNKNAEANRQYKKYQEKSGSPTLDNGWDYSESAMQEGDKDDARSSTVIIEKHSYGFSEFEWERLAKVYDFIGDNTKKQEIMNKIAEARKRQEEERKRQERLERKGEARGKFSLAVATNPLMYIWSDYPISLDIRIGRVSSEFRVNISSTRDGGPGDKYRFGQWNAKDIANDHNYYYSGYEFSYTLKILSKEKFKSTNSKRKEFVGTYVGFQPRYSTYTFDGSNVAFKENNSCNPNNL